MRCTLLGLLGLWLLGTGFASAQGLPEGTYASSKGGYTYPDLLAIAKKEEGKLTVVRLTDLTQPSAQDTSSPESSESDQKEEGGKALKDTEGQNQAEENAG